MSWEQFYQLQQILITATWPFVSFWTMVFVVLGVAVALLIYFMIVSRELLARGPSGL